MLTNRILRSKGRLSLRVSALLVACLAACAVVMAILGPVAGARTGSVKPTSGITKLKDTQGLPADVVAGSTGPTLGRRSVPSSTPISTAKVLEHGIQFVKAAYGPQLYAWRVAYQRTVHHKVSYSWSVRGAQGPHPVLILRFRGISRPVAKWRFFVALAYPLTAAQVKELNDGHPIVSPLGKRSRQYTRFPSLKVLRMHPRTVELAADAMQFNSLGQILMRVDSPKNVQPAWVTRRGVDGALLLGNAFLQAHPVTSLSLATLGQQTKFFYQTINYQTLNSGSQGSKPVKWSRSKFTNWLSHTSGAVLLSWPKGSASTVRGLENVPVSSVTVLSP